MKNNALLQVIGLKKYFPVIRGIFLRRKVADIKAVDNVDLYITKGETLGLVGESGCGKTTVGMSILQLQQPTSGEIFFAGTDLCKLDNNGIHKMRQKMQMIFQDPYSSLNPRMTIGNILSEPFRVHNLYKKEERRERIQELLQAVGLGPSFVNRYPYELSGGQRQRIGIARALAVKPDLIVCDEPVSALDVSVQAQIINLLMEIQLKYSLAYLFIAHDLAVVRHISDRIAVMYLGKIVEVASRGGLFKHPLHPYTKALLSAVPVPDPVVEAHRHRLPLAGEVPSTLNPPPGCSFHTRCSFTIGECREVEPVLKNVDNVHWVRCHLI